MKIYEPEDDEPVAKRYAQCSDRMCGAEDCPNCRPENFRGGIYVGGTEPEDHEAE